MITTTSLPTGPSYTTRAQTAPSVRCGGVGGAPTSPMLQALPRGNASMTAKR